MKAISSHCSVFALVAILNLLGFQPLWAGGGPSGVIVIYNPSDPVAVTIASRYQQRRGIPEQNMIPYVFPSAGFTRTTAWDFVYSLRSTLSQRGLSDQVQAIALAGVMPVDSKQSQVDDFSLQSFLYLSPNYGQGSFPLNPLTQKAFPLAITGATPSGTTSIAGRDFSGQKYLPTAAIGYPGKSGNSPKEVLSFIDRWATRDGIKAEGTVYWVLNSDVRSDMRERFRNEVLPVWRARGIRHAVVGDRNATAVAVPWVTNRPDIAGGVVGAALIPKPAAGNTFLPGSWVDHVTSSGGALDDFSPAQTRLAVWLRAGADGSSGAFAEPGTITTKFPHPHIHTHLRAGATMAEAFWLSVRSPAQVVCVSDPLLQPWADLPVVNITSPSNGATVSGVTSLGVSAAPTGGKSLETQIDLFVKGRRVSIGSSSEPVMASRTSTGFLVNTATLPDGWNELRVAAYNNDSIRSQREAAVGIFVSNAGQSVQLVGPESANPDIGATFSVTPSGIADLVNISLRSAGRILATTPATIPLSGGTFSVNAGEAPLDGPWVVNAVVTRSNGQEIWSAPVSTAISWPATPAASSEPTLGPQAADVRYFADTTSSSFAWDTTSPTSTAAVPLDATHGLYLTGSNIPGVTISDYTKRPGLEISCWFFAPVEDWYEFGFHFFNGNTPTPQFSADREFAVNGLSLQERDLVFGPRRLAPGWHQLRMRTKLTGAGFTGWRIRVRGGATQDFVGFTRATTANQGTSNPLDRPTSLSIDAAADPVLSQTTALTANATIGSGAAGELAALSYHWTGLGPGPVTFSASGTNAAKSTTATFSQPGNYTLSIMVSGSAGASQTSRTISVVASPGSMIVDKGSVPEVTRGEPLALAAFTRDQFSAVMPVVPLNPALPTVQWTSSDPGGTFVIDSDNGERATFRTLTNSSTPYSVTITATGVNGRNGSATTTLIINPNIDPSFDYALGWDASAEGNSLRLSARLVDGETTGDRNLNFTWSVVAVPPGQTLTLSENGYRSITAAPSGPGVYAVKIEGSDQSGSSTSATHSFTVQPDGTILAPANVKNPASVATNAGEMVTFSAPTAGGLGGTVTTKWQRSSNGGNTWEDIPGATGPTLTLGPVSASENGQMFRQLAVVGDLSTASLPATLTLDPNVTVVGFVDPSDIIIDEASGTYSIVLRRYGKAGGAVSATVTLFPSTARLGQHYRGFDGANGITATASWASGVLGDRTLSFPIIDNSVIDGAASQGLTNLSVNVAVSSGPAVEQRDNNIQVSIRDNDGPGFASFVPDATNVSPTVNEAAGSVALRVRRSGPRVGGLTVGYRTGVAVPGIVATAAPNVDYMATSGTLTWSEGDGTDKTISIPLVDGGQYRGDRIFTVGLTGDAATMMSPTEAVITIQDKPFQRWQSQWWPAVFPSVAETLESYPDLASAVAGLSPFAHYRMNETSGTTVSGVDGSGTIVSTGTFRVNGSGTYQLGTAGPRPPEWSGLASENTGLAFTASGSTGTPVAYSAGASVNLGTANGFGAQMKNGFTISAFVKTSVTDRVMTLIGGARSGTNTNLLIMINRAFSPSNVAVPHSLRIFLRAEGNQGNMDFSIPLSGLPTGSLCDGQWHHIAIAVPPITSAIDPQLPVFYFDGEPVSPLEVRGSESLTTASSFLDFSDVGLRVGSNGNLTPAGFFAGSVDEIAFLPGMLNGQQIAQLLLAGPQLPPPAFTSGMGDPNGDGVPNLLAYALGGNPLVSSSPVQLPTLGMAGDRLSLNFLRLRDAIDIEYRVLASSDLQTWTPIWTSENSAYSGGGTSMLQTVLDSLPLSSTPRRFLRLEVTNNTEE